MTERALTDGQRRLVEENLALVAWHIRRSVPGIDRPSRDREWDDLFQEGCLGLAQAAATYDPRSGVSFATFALRRIQASVSRALHCAFATVRIPANKRTGGVRSGEAPRKTISLDADVLARRAPSRHRPDRATIGESIGARIRSKYDRAVCRARSATKTSPGRRDDRDALIDRLVEDRLLIPDDDQRRPLRQIARDTKSSYSRVVQTEKRLIEHIRSVLEADLELPTLQAEARRRRNGADTLVDEAVAGRVAAALENRFNGLFNNGPPGRRGEMLLALMERCGLDARVLARSLFGRLNPREKAALVSTGSAPVARLTEE